MQKECSHRRNDLKEIQNDTETANMRIIDFLLAFVPKRVVFPLLLGKDYKASSKVGSLIP